MLELFTGSARRVVVAAATHARELRHVEVGTEDLLVGLLSEEDSAAGRILAELGVTVGSTSAALGGPEPASVSATAPQFSKQSKNSLEEAHKAMLWRHDNKITTAHLLLGLVEQGRGIAMSVLRDRGLDRGMLRQHVAIEVNRRRVGDSGD